ncbi:uncharacterized protein F4812DRAFT_414599 [Daldinia caldariorum]|uniref:uncharacterized protein n=1 Tax=Daldinia caldariorum TaxID=326644 RepID=UPI002007F7D2|nr:uncharacterized protein F4812DRAFT_414599 [Daldinia caldariorum]KAI1471566.1 hypothetical protein F4812DRAFT_414599 [Daldinia caldariorum]
MVLWGRGFCDRAWKGGISQFLDLRGPFSCSTHLFVVAFFFFFFFFFFSSVAPSLRRKGGRIQNTYPVYMLQAFRVLFYLLPFWRGETRPGETRREIDYHFFCIIAKKCRIAFFPSRLRDSGEPKLASVCGGISCYHAKRGRFFFILFFCYASGRVCQCVGGRMTIGFAMIMGRP